MNANVSSCDGPSVLGVSVDVARALGRVVMRITMQVASPLAYRFLINPSS
jgi:hypothetical protein